MKEGYKSIKCCGFARRGFGLHELHFEVLYGRVFGNDACFEGLCTADDAVELFL